MYYYIPGLCGAVALVMGLMMIFCPKVMVKKEYREDEEQLSKSKKSGIFMTIAGILLVGISVFNIVIR